MRIGVSTGGGDAPGLNAVVRAVTLSALSRGWEVLGIRKGYQGLLDTDKIIRLDRAAVRGIAHLGGTILGTTNRGDPFELPLPAAEGEEPIVVDRSNLVVENFRRLGLDSLVVIGGDGSMRIAHRFAEKGMPIVGVPKTIDNDIAGTSVTFGFDTAVAVATEAIDRLHSTAEAHERVFVVEVMGRYAGWIALHAGLAGGADVILIPEIPFSVESVCAKIAARERSGRRFAIVIVAEGATLGGERVIKGPKEAGREVRLGGIGDRLAQLVQEGSGKETRCLVLGHLQRGGRPTARDRLIGMRFGAGAVRTVAEGTSSVMVALDPPDVITVPLSEASRTKTVPLDSDTILSAREMGICLGDEVE